MPSVQQLLSRAATLLRSYTILWVPPLGLALLMVLANPGGPRAGSTMFLIVSLINLAVTLGWLELIGQADRDTRPTWDNFFTAIGRHFGAMVAGTLALFGLVLVVALPLVLAAYYWADPTTLAALAKEGPELTRRLQADPNAIMTVNPAYLQATLRLLVGVMAGAVWFGLVSLGLLYWNQALVLGNLGWQAAWRDSLAVLRQYWGVTLGLLTLQSVGYVVGFAAGAGPMPLDLLGWMLVFFCQVLFPVVFTLLYRRARPLVEVLA